MNGGTIALLIAGLVNIGVGIYLSTQDGKNGTVFIAVGAIFAVVAAIQASSSKNGTDKLTGGQEGED